MTYKSIQAALSSGKAFPELVMKLDKYREEREKKRREQLAIEAEKHKRQQKLKQREEDIAAGRVTISHAPRSR